VNDPTDAVDQQDERNQDEQNLNAKHRAIDRHERDDHGDEPDDNEDRSHPVRHTHSRAHVFSLMQPIISFSYKALTAFTASGMSGYV